MIERECKVIQGLGNYPSVFENFIWRAVISDLEKEGWVPKPSSSFLSQEILFCVLERITKIKE